VELRQGITSTVSGQCGLSVVPCPPERKGIIFDFLRTITASIDPAAPFSTFGEYAAYIEKLGMPLNYGCCIGNGTTRMAVNGFEGGRLTPQQVKEVHAHIRSSLEAGALGVTMGIVYSPENNYDVDGFVEALQPMKDFDVPLVTHIRGEGDILHESLREVIAVAKALGVHLNVCHFKCVGKHNWGHGAKKALDIVRQAREDGLRITIDAYPYTAGATQMIQYLPPDYLDGGTDETVRKLADPASRKRLIEILEKPQDYFENMLLASGWDKTIITAVKTEPNQQYVGLTVTQLAEKLGKNPYDAAFDLLVEERCSVGMVNFTASEEDNRMIISDEHCSVISDALYSDGGLPHPRVYGAFPRVLETFVREENLFPLETAIHKMTRQPAEVYRLDQKGLIAVGMDADFAIFDLDKVQTKATYIKPELATGFDYVIIGGEVAVEADVWQKKLPGKFLRGRAAK
jgi:N-acyl-D-aspartate/D-glutamate deacylase